MAFYHDYFIRYNLKNKKINIEKFNKVYSLKEFSLSKINLFFKNYDSIELIKKEYFAKNNVPNLFKQEITELFFDSLKKSKHIKNKINEKNKIDEYLIPTYEKNDEESLFMAIEINDVNKVKTILSSNVKINNKYPYLSRVKNMEILNLLLTEDLIDLSNPNHYPKLAQIANYNYPFEEMILKGFNINSIDITQLNIVILNNEYSNNIQNAYFNLLKMGLNPNKKSHSGNSALFYITNKEIALLAINKGADVNYKKGICLLQKILLDKDNTAPEILNKRIDIIDLLLSSKASLGDDVSNLIKNDVIIGFGIPKEYLNVLKKHNKINTEKLRLTAENIKDNLDFFKKMIVNGDLSINNIEGAYALLKGDVSHSLMKIEVILSKPIFQMLINNIKNIHEKSVNDNTFIEQCILERRTDLIDNLNINFKDICLEGNEQFQIMFEPIQGKITNFSYFEGDKAESFYDWLVSKNLLSSKEKYSLEEIEDIPLRIGKKLYEDGIITDNNINPLLTRYVNCKKGTLNIYAIRNNNLGKIKDNNGKNLLHYCSSESDAYYLLKRKAIKITGLLDEYNHNIRPAILKRIKNETKKEKEKIIESISNAIDNVDSNSRKKRI